MKRIIIIGGNGSGKTYASKIISEKTKLPLCHLDKLYWTDNWQPRDRSEFLSLLQDELKKDEWILDGNMRRTLNERLKYADTVIYFDFSGIRCFFGVIKRLILNYGKTRADMGGKCTEKLDKRSVKFIKSTLSFNKNNRSYFYNTIKEFPEVKLIVLKNRREVNKFLKSL